MCISLHFHYLILIPFFLQKHADCALAGIARYTILETARCADTNNKHCSRKIIMARSGSYVAIVHLSAARSERARKRKGAIATGLEGRISVVVSYLCAFRGIKVSLQCLYSGRKIIITGSENNDPQTYIDKIAT